MPRTLQRADVGIHPAAKTALQQQPGPLQVGFQIDVGAKLVVAVLAVANGGVGVIVHTAAAAGDQHVGPPIVRDGRDVFSGLAQQVARGPVEDHGVAARDALHQGVAEVGRALEQRRVADVLVARVH